MNRFVTVDIDGEIQTHLPHPTENYATLCGLDGDDSDHNTRQSIAEPGKQVDCQHCIAIFELCRRYRAKDFILA